MQQILWAKNSATPISSVAADRRRGHRLTGAPPCGEPSLDCAIRPSDVVAMKKVLHPGCGRKTVVGAHPLFPVDGWNETRVDIDPAADPDIVASMTAMAMVPDASHDAIYTAHTLEHVFAHELPLALAEFRRVMRPGGFLLAQVPNLQKAAAAIAAGRWNMPLYDSPGGPVAPMDMLYGHADVVARFGVHMGHRNGFTPATLGGAIRDAGFVAIQIASIGYDLLAMAFKDARPAGSPRIAG